MNRYLNAIADDKKEKALRPVEAVFMMYYEVM